MPHLYKYVYAPQEEAKAAAAICRKTFDAAWKDLNGRFYIKRFVLERPESIAVRKICTADNPDRQSKSPILFDIEYSYCIFEWTGPLCDVFDAVRSSLSDCGKERGLIRTEFTEWGILCSYKAEGVPSFATTVRIALMTGRDKGTFLRRNQSGEYVACDKFSIKKEKERLNAIPAGNAEDEFRQLYLYYRSRQLSGKYEGQSPFYACRSAYGDALSKMTSVNWQIKQYNKWSHKNPL